ncbi:MAG TPA: ABC transporter ATP-binding protein [Fimbriimonadaceae bacterium]|nr:ABC transporter ATP-binding protein [Fimbriimonadaceae bacterium]
MASKLSDPRLTSTDGKEPDLTFGQALRVLAAFWRFVRPYRSKFFLALALLMFSVPLVQFALFLTRDVTNQALVTSDLTSEERWSIVIKIIALQAAFWLGSNLLSVGREVLEWYVSMRSTFDLRMAFYKHLHRLPMSFLARRTPGEHLFRATTDMVSMFSIKNRVETANAAGQFPPESKEVAMAFYSNDVDPFDPGIMGMISRTVPLMIETIYAVAWGAALLYLIDPILSLCLLIYAIPFAILSHRAFNRVRKTAFAFKQRTEFETGVLRDSIAGLRTLKAFGRTTYQLRRFFKAAANTRRRGIQLALGLVLTQNGLQQGMKWAFTTLIYVYLASRIVRGQATVGDWVATALLLEAAQMPLQNFVQLFQLIKMQTVPAQRILQTLDEKPTLEDRPGAVRLPRLDGKLTFENVSFSYIEGRPALREVRFDIEAGQYVGIVGPSGAGKSSLVALALRLYAPQEGSVRIDGIDVRDLELQSYLEQVGTVLQSTYLYSGTIAENVLFGNPWASEQELARALHLSGVDLFAARQPSGLDTEIGEGMTISGGERQRIGIARALVRNPRILMLDEATASLDPATEEAVLESIERCRPGRTILSIAHRLKAVVSCDRILVMEAGRIVQTGVHKELLAQPGLYRSLWEEQRREEATTEGVPA